MTLEQTRQLGIEFERRVQTMIPETEFVAKLDTETIYSYINLYQDKLIHDLYRTVDQIPISNGETYIETLLLTMMSSVDISNNSKNKYKLPDDFGLYIDSYSTVYTTYEYKGTGESGTIPNQLIAVKDVNKVIQRPQDDMRILRQPVVWLTEDKYLGIIVDRYTNLKDIHINYYKIPNYMDLMTSTPCELPMEMFEPLVSGAVDLYVQYVAGAEARKRQMNEQLRQLRKQKDEDE